MEASDVFLQFRARLASTQHLVSLLSVIGDRRVKRVIELLNEISYHGEVIPPCFREILRICSDDPLRYRGFHLRLNHLDEQVSKATDVLVESSKRIILYLDHIKANDSKLPVSTRLLTHSAVHEQMELARSLRQKAHLATSAALAKPPGPAPMPYDNPRDEAITKPNLERKLVEGKPYPIGKDYDARWDPDFKMPGSQHGKFFKFPGPFFSPDTTHAIFDHFLLSETVADLLENFNRKFSDCLANFKNTNRFQAEEDVAMLEGLGEQIGNELANEGNYDLDSICLHTRTRPRDTSTTVGPYVSCWQVRKSRIGTGVFAMEDLNRMLTVLELGRQGSMMSPFDTGCQIFFDRRISGAKQHWEA